MGGRLCLDFVNTTGARDTDAPRERIHAYRDLLVWSRRADLITGEEESRLAAEAERRPEAAGETLERAIRIRKTLYDVLRPLAEGEQPEAADLSALDVLLGESAGRRALRIGPEGGSWTWSREPEELEWFLWPIVQSAERLVTSGDLARLKRCGECDWLFVDETRNDSRRWCKKLCGDRVRARRHYRRRKAR